MGRPWTNPPVEQACFSKQSSFHKPFDIAIFDSLCNTRCEVWHGVGSRRSLTTADIVSMDSSTFLFFDCTFGVLWGALSIAGKSLILTSLSQEFQSFISSSVEKSLKTCRLFDIAFPTD